ncbi:MAG: hypothetical protein ACM3TR_11515 [Caulobacteraceae bacterium]
MAKGGIEVNTKQLDRLAIELKGFEKEVGEAAYHALNRTVDHVITQIGRIIPKEYAVKSKDVKATLKGNKPSVNDLSASVISKGHTLSFAHFPYTPKTDKRGRGSEVKVKIKNVTGKIKSQKGFVANTGAKSEDKTLFNVFMRLGEFKIPEEGSYAGKVYKRGPKAGQRYVREIIAPIRTLSIPQMITNEKVAEKVLKEAQDKLDERLEHEIVFRMTNLDKKIKR